MDAKEKRALETQLVKMGLPGIDSQGNPSGELVQQIANVVNHHHSYENRQGEWIDKHKLLRDLLNECEADKRYEMYHALRPKLTFIPLPLPQYEDMIAEKAGRLVSQHRARVTGDRPQPIEIGGNQYAIAPKQIATGAIATLRCYRCQKSARFHADTPTGAMIEGRKAGWVREPGVNKEACPECAAQNAAEEVVALSRNQVLVVNDRRKVN